METDFDRENPPLGQVTFIVLFSKKSHNRIQNAENLRPRRGTELIEAVIEECENGTESFRTNFTAKINSDTVTSFPSLSLFPSLPLSLPALPPYLPPLSLSLSLSLSLEK